MVEAAGIEPEGHGTVATSEQICPDAEVPNYQYYRHRATSPSNSAPDDSATFGDTPNTLFDTNRVYGTTPPIADSFSILSQIVCRWPFLTASQRHTIMLVAEIRESEIRNS